MFMSSNHRLHSNIYEFESATAQQRLWVQITDCIATFMSSNQSAEVGGCGWKIGNNGNHKTCLHMRSHGLEMKWEAHLCKEWSSTQLTQLWPGAWFDIKMPSYQYRKSHCGDKTVVRSSYVCNSSALAMELHHSCTNPTRCVNDHHMLIYSMMAHEEFCHRL